MNRDLGPRLTGSWFDCGGWEMLRKENTETERGESTFTLSFFCICMCVCMLSGLWFWIQIHSTSSPAENQTWRHEPAKPAEYVCLLSVQLLIFYMDYGCGFWHIYCSTVIGPEPCPSLLLQRHMAELLNTDKEMAASFLNSVLNQLNWAFSEFIGMIQEVYIHTC